MKNTSALIFAGLTLGVINPAYTPTPKARPSREFIETTYLQKTLFGYVKSNKKSEERRQILQNIHRIREQIRTVAQQPKTDKLCMDCIKSMTQKTLIRSRTIKEQRAKELEVSVKYIKEDVVAKRNGIVIIDNFEI